MKNVKCKRHLITAIVKDPYISDKQKKEMLAVIGREYADYMKKDNVAPALKELYDLADPEVKNQEYDCSTDSIRLQNGIKRIRDMGEEVGIDEIKVGMLTDLIIRDRLKVFDGIGRTTERELAHRLIEIYKKSAKKDPESCKLIVGGEEHEIKPCNLEYNCGEDMISKNLRIEYKGYKKEILCTEREAHGIVQSFVDEVNAKEKGESTSYPFWCIIDPKQNFKVNEQGISTIANMITGIFFSRESAESFLKSKQYDFSKNARVWCFSGCYSEEWRNK